MSQAKKEIYDIAIIGAGPAGSVFARELALSLPNLKILLIDGQTSKSPKPCGGLLAPDAQKLLARFDLPLPNNILENPQIFAVKTIDLKTRKVRYYQRHYLNMDRLAFDNWLISLIPNSVKIERGKCTKITNINDLYELSIIKDGSKKSICTKVLVGADGGNSIVRRTFFKPMKNQYIAIQQWFKSKKDKTPYYSCVFDQETSDSCSWVMHKGEHIIFGGAFIKKNCRKAFNKQKEKLEQFLSYSFGEATKTEACLVSSPRTPKDFCTGKGNVFLIGEAAGFISASSFEGISSAMLSGKILADSLASPRKNKQKLYKAKTRKLRCKLIRKSIKRKFLCSPFFRNIILKSGIQSISPFHK